MRIALRALSCALALSASGAALCQPAVPPPPPPVLPPPSTDPLAVDLSTDPILRLARSQAPAEQFRALIDAAVEHHPGTLEAEANTAEARSVVSESNELALPLVDLH